MDSLPKHPAPAQIEKVGLVVGNQRFTGAECKRWGLDDPSSRWGKCYVLLTQPWTWAFRVEPKWYVRRWPNEVIEAVCQELNDHRYFQQPSPTPIEALLDEYIAYWDARGFPQVLRMRPDEVDGYPFVYISYTATIVYRSIEAQKATGQYDTPGAEYIRRLIKPRR